MPGRHRGRPFSPAHEEIPREYLSGRPTATGKEITDVVTNQVLPAYQAFGNFIATEYAPHGRTTLAITSLGGGEERYLNDIRSRTTIGDMTPDQIHQTGLHEIERIQADMVAIAHQEGFKDPGDVP